LADGKITAENRLRSFFLLSRIEKRIFAVCLKQQPHYGSKKSNGSESRSQAHGIVKSQEKKKRNRKLVHHKGSEKYRSMNFGITIRNPHVREEWIC
jgi:hypothetical protein